MKTQIRELNINVDIETLGKSNLSLNKLRQMKSARSLNNSESIVKKSIKKDIEK